MYSQILCYVLEKWIRTQYQKLLGNDSWFGSKIHHNTELWTQLTENRWNSSGKFSQHSPNYSSSTKSKSSWTKWATQHNSKDELSSCRCWMTSYGDLKTMNRNVLLTPHLCLHLQKDFQQDTGHPRTWIRNKMVFYLQWKTWRRMGQSRWIDDYQNSEKADTQFSEPRVRCLEERSKAKEVDNHLFTSVPMGIRLKLFFAQFFCKSAQYLRSSLRFVWSI